MLEKIHRRLADVDEDTFMEIMTVVSLALGLATAIGVPAFIELIRNLF